MKWMGKYYREGEDRLESTTCIQCEIEKNELNAAIKKIKNKKL